MQRRSAVKSLALSFGGLLSLPAWASGWTPESIGLIPNVPADQESFLGEIVETLIPQTNTPGAKALNVHRFALRMIRDCYDPQASTTLQQGLALTDSTAQQAYSKLFVDCEATQRADVLARLTNSTDPTAKPFVDMIKGLTIQGYTNSEFYMTTIQKFNMAPGYYHGCVPVQSVPLGAGH
ncbi:hypothetical protein GCM10028806_21930 [Spirosoma terrae]|uniref:Gluconate 2-dehydrogenase subunit 3 family protein n=1 Tax=Spirosoma terrae TaxID=1968276 RepID=A0A6L9L5V5_9BACT|nr:gluconate 2-dehydrogenase subunit 3 family protein [Spirosoma terrae]NDU94491.1 gluconate 2-dehydrogenase subunit 3 family protein [Spirosoma terrae]